jgi:hypothetical protein
MNEVLLKLDTDGLSGTMSTLGECVDDAWPEIDAHPGLDKDQRAELTREFEAIEEAVANIRRIIGVSSENDT